MQPYGIETTKNCRYLLAYEKDYKYNIGVRTNRCKCKYCKKQYKGMKRGRRYDKGGED